MFGEHFYHPQTKGVCVAKGGMHRGCAWQGGVCVQESMHPTGMHSCNQCWLVQFIGTKILNNCLNFPVRQLSGFLWSELISINYCPQTKLQEGNVFTPVCDSVYRGCLCRGGLCPGGSPGSLCPWGGLCPGGSFRGFSVQGDPPGGFCPGGSLSRETLHTVTSRQYTSYWNTFLFKMLVKNYLLLGGWFTKVMKVF